jgi:hypothetical protein
MNQRRNEKLHPDGQYFILIIYQWVCNFKIKIKACVILTTMNPIITVAAILSETVQKPK